MRGGMRRLLAIVVVLLAPSGLGCSAAFGSPCGTPNEVVVDGRVLDAAGNPLAFAGELCVEVEYCEPTWSGCDPPNGDRACAPVTTDAQGSFTAKLRVSSPDPKDLITHEQFILGKAHVWVDAPRGDECSAESLTFVSP